MCMAHICTAQYNYRYSYQRAIDSQYIYLIVFDSMTNSQSISEYGTIQERKVIIKNNKAHRITYINGEDGIDNYAWVKSDTETVVTTLNTDYCYALFPKVPRCWDFEDNHFFLITRFFPMFRDRLGMESILSGVDKISLIGLKENKYIAKNIISGTPQVDFLCKKYSIVEKHRYMHPFNKTKEEVFEEIRQNIFFDMLVDDKQQLYYFGIEQDTLKVWEFDKKRVRKDFEDDWKLLHAYKLPLKGYFSAIQKNNTFYIISNEGHIFKLGKKAKKIGTIGRKLSEVVLIDDKDNETLGWLPKNTLPNFDKYSVKYIVESANKIILK